jgi:hypothetical protein
MASSIQTSYFPKTLLQEFDREEHCLCVGDIGRFPFSLRPQDLQLALDIFQRAFVTSNKANPVAFARETSRDRATHTRRGAGDDDCTSFTAVTRHGRPCPMPRTG